MRTRTGSGVVVVVVVVCACVCVCLCGVCVAFVCVCSSRSRALALVLALGASAVDGYCDVRVHARARAPTVPLVVMKSAPPDREAGGFADCHDRRIALRVVRSIEASLLG